MSDINFQPLYEYFDERFNELRSDIKHAGGKVDLLTNSVDGLSRQVLSFQQEMAITTMRMSRTDDWIQTAAQKLQIPYNL